MNDGAVLVDLNGMMSGPPDSDTEINVVFYGHFLRW